MVIAPQFSNFGFEPELTNALDWPNDCNAQEADTIIKHGRPMDEAARAALALVAAIVLLI
ncbi:MAG: hypothetical protein AAF666_15035 [Pseudomonadota bacterium]